MVWESGAFDERILFNFRGHLNLLSRFDLFQICPLLPVIHHVCNTQECRGLIQKDFLDKSGEKIKIRKKNCFEVGWGNGC